MSQKTFNFAPRPKLKLSAIEELIRKHRIITPCPSRQSLVNMCEDGTFEAVKTNGGWLVFETSFYAWSNSLDAVPVAA